MDTFDNYFNYNYTAIEGLDGSRKTTLIQRIRAAEHDPVLESLSKVYSILPRLVYFSALDRGIPSGKFIQNTIINNPEGIDESIRFACFAQHFREAIRVSYPFQSSYNEHPQGVCGAISDRSWLSGFVYNRTAFESALRIYETQGEAGIRSLIRCLGFPPIRFCWLLRNTRHQVQKDSELDGMERMVTQNFHEMDERYLRCKEIFSSVIQNFEIIDSSNDDFPSDEFIERVLLCSGIRVHQQSLKHSYPQYFSNSRRGIRRNQTL